MDVPGHPLKSFRCEWTGGSCSKAPLANRLSDPPEVTGEELLRNSNRASAADSNARVPPARSRAFPPLPWLNLKQAYRRIPAKAQQKANIFIDLPLRLKH